MTYLLPTAASALLCTVLYVLKARQRSPFQIFYLALLALAIVPSFFDPIGTSVDFHPFANPLLVSDDLVTRAQVTVAITLAMFLAFELAFPARPITVIADSARGAGLFGLVPLALLAVCALTAMIFGVGYSEGVSFGDLREGPLQKPFLVISYLSIIAIGLPVYFYATGKRFLLVALSLGALAFPVLVLGGTRQPIAIALVVLAIFALGRRRHGVWLVLLLFVAGFPLGDVVLSAMKALRNAASLELRLTTLSQFFSGDFSALEGTSNESGLRYVMYLVLGENGLVAQDRLSYLARALLFWMPSAVDVFAIKPDDFELELFAFAMPGADSPGTMHATFVGSAFADAGWAIPLWVAFTVGVHRVLEALIRSRLVVQPILLWGACGYMAVMTARGSLYAPLVVLLAVVMLTVLDSGLRLVVGRLSAREPVARGVSGAVSRPAWPSPGRPAASCAAPRPSCAARPGADAGASPARPA